MRSGRPLSRTPGRRSSRRDTQIEWQATSRVPVSQYFFNGSFAHLRISGQNLSAPVRLGPEYMIPFAVGVPPSWNFFYYSRSAAGYSQVG